MNKIYLLHAQLEDGYGRNAKTFAFSSEEKARLVEKKLGERSHLEVLEIDSLDEAVAAMAAKKQPWLVTLGTDGSVKAEPVSSLHAFLRALAPEAFENGRYGHYAHVFAPSADQAIATARALVAKGNG